MSGENAQCLLGRNTRKVLAADQKLDDGAATAPRRIEPSVLGGFGGRVGRLRGQAPKEREVVARTVISQLGAGRAAGRKASRKERFSFQLLRTTGRWSPGPLSDRGACRVGVYGNHGGRQRDRNDNEYANHDPTDHN